MEHTTVLEQLSILLSREPGNVLAQVTSRWIKAEAALGRGQEAANDPLIADVVGRARLATDCGWLSEANRKGGSDISGNKRKSKMSETSNKSEESSRDLVLYCDGSCINNGKAEARAGYGIYVTKDGEPVHSHSGRVNSGDAQTNQRAELLAIQYALNYLGESGQSAIIYTDSKYAIDCLTTWAPAWEKAGWKKSDKKPILHLDIIQPCLELVSMIGCRVDIQHIAGHSGSAGNDEADRLARLGALSQ
jgi:ribonuclease HI